jgi:hypothetical protein
MAAARKMPTPLAMQFTNPQGFWYRLHRNCRRSDVLRGASHYRHQQERRRPA